ncbi:MAG: hypothetical protein CVU47_11845 [Chloroflexi bacterium HGW-Chloroflexi-9]|nr:MAG: hypothetical protein CVU47_11845 [Chloroflexi bacterium HGW-Chloroflexi-9]
MHHSFATRVTRRTLLRGAMIGTAGLAGMALLGCSDDEDPTPAPTESPTASPTEEMDEEMMDATPIDLGPAKMFDLVAGWYRGEEARYYDFGTSSPVLASGAIATAPIWVLTTGMNADGTPRLVEGQHNIVDVIPGEAGYSDLWEVRLVTVPEDYVADSIHSAADLQAMSYPVTPAGLFVNCPIVPAGSTFEGGELLVQGWYRGQQVFYPDFGPNPPVAISIWAFITGMDAGGAPMFVEGQHNIIDAVPGAAAYSAFWDVNLVMAPEGYGANSIISAEEVVAAGLEIVRPGLVVNCPVVSPTM